MVRHIILKAGTTTTTNEDPVAYDSWMELHDTNVAVWYGEISGKQAEGLFGGWWFHVGSSGCCQSWPLKASERTRRGSSIEHQVTRQGLMNSWRRSWWFNIALYISESSCLDSRPPLPSLQSTQMGGAEPSWWQMLSKTQRIIPKPGRKRMSPQAGLHSKDSTSS